MHRHDVLLVEDEKMLVSYYREALERNGYAVRAVGTGEAALEELGRDLPSLVLLDLNLAGDVNGFEVLSAVRSRMIDVPIMIISARGNSNDIVRGLELGADNYVTKPVSPRELVARVRAEIRRARAGTNGKLPEAASLYRFGNLTIDLSVDEQGVAACRGQSMTLAPAETRILRRLLETPGVPVAPKDLFVSVWHAEASTFSMYEKAALATAISRLRQKMRALGYMDDLVCVVRRQGYYIEFPETQCVYRFGELTLDVVAGGRATVECGARSRKLTVLETRILRRLLESSGTVVEARDLYRAVWRPEGGGFGEHEQNVVWNAVYRLRKKIQALGYDGDLIHNVRHVGYFIDEPN